MNNGPLFVPARKVIPREEFGALDDATHYNEESRRVYNSVQEFADKAVEEARERGFREGFEEGRSEAFQILSQAIDEARHRLFVLEDLLNPIVLSAVEKIIGSMDDRVLVRKALREALAEAGHSMAVTLRVAPEDLDDIRDLVDDMHLESGAQMLETVRPDPVLKEGEMILETAQGRVHIGLYQQMQRLRAGLDPTGGGH